MPPAISKKRKLGDGDKKYYAVRAGKEPGVYTEWQDCKDNTYGFKGASYKSFLTRKDAEDFVAGKNPPGPSDAKDPDKFYGVAVGHKTGVYTEWTEVQQQINNVKGPKYKKFATRKEAEEFVKSKGKLPAPEVSKVSQNGAGKADVEDGPTAKKVKNGTSSSKKENIKVYTDGSSLGNGKSGASAGVGVYFGGNDPRNVSEPLEGQPQTNQRAELMAIVKALEIVPKDQNLEILTDSQYSINCVTVWYKSWVAKNWMKSDGGQVMNKDLVVMVRKLIDQRDASGAVTAFTWIKGHSNNLGNIAADGLAVAGAQRRS